MVMTISELWADIEGYEGTFQVSNLGRLRRLWWFGFRFLSGSFNSSKGCGYYEVTLRYKGTKKTIGVHILVARAFIGICPSGKEVHHKDGITTNNHFSNLEYVTRSRNVEHAWNTGLRERRFFSEQEIVEINDKHLRGISSVKLGKEYQVSDATIRRILKKERNFIKRVV